MLRISCCIQNKYFIETPFVEINFYSSLKAVIEVSLYRYLLVETINFWTEGVNSDTCSKWAELQLHPNKDDLYTNESD